MKPTYLILLPVAIMAAATCTSITADTDTQAKVKQGGNASRGNQPDQPPISPPRGPTQWLFQGPPADSKFLPSRNELARQVRARILIHRLLVTA